MQLEIGGEAHTSGDAVQPTINTTGERHSTRHSPYLDLPEQRKCEVFGSECRNLYLLLPRVRRVSVYPVLPVHVKKKIIGGKDF